MLRALLGALCAVLCTAVAAQDLGAGAARLHVASADETRRALAVDDDWTAVLSPFHIAATLGRSGPVSREELKTALPQVARDCTDVEAQRWRTAFDKVAPRYQELQMRLPATVNVSCTTGADSAGAPYTRGDTVFMPPVREDAGPRDAFVMAHELFHIFSRHHPAVASRLYALIGFREAPPLAWPAEWLGARISNPDAPLDRHAVAIEVEGRPYTVMPVLVARRTSLQPGESFFSVMDVRLVAVERSADGRSSTPLRRDGQPVWFDANRTDSYLRQLGGNTGYVIHPEETTADNIALLVNGQPARNPGLVQRMRETLLSKAPPP
jgi:hypothetical protein